MKFTGTIEQIQEIEKQIRDTGCTLQIPKAKFKIVQKLFGVDYSDQIALRTKMLEVFPNIKAKKLIEANNKLDLIMFSSFQVKFIYDERNGKGQIKIPQRLLNALSHDRIKCTKHGIIEINGDNICPICKSDVIILNQAIFPELPSILKGLDF